MFLGSYNLRGNNTTDKTIFNEPNLNQCVYNTHMKLPNFNPNFLSTLPRVNYSRLYKSQSAFSLLDSVVQFGQSE